MKKIAFGLAALLLLGTAPVIAADVTAGAKVNAGAAVKAPGAETDATTTGSINAEANYGQLISGLRSNQEIDLSAFNDQTNVKCVTVSSLQGNSDNGASLEGAITAGKDRLAQLHTDLQSNAAAWSKIEASCPDVADLSLDKVLWIESGAGGMFTVFVDDRDMAAGGAMSSGAGASTSSGAGASTSSGASSSSSGGASSY